MTKKLDINNIKKFFVSEGYELLSTVYKNSKTKLTVKCPKGHIYETSWFNWHINKSRCPYCSKTGVKLTYTSVKSDIESEGYILQSTEYINNKTKLKTICPNKHVYYVSYGNWKQGRRCPKCRQKITDSEIITDIETNGFTVLDSEPLKRTAIHYMCNKGHKHKTTVSDWLRGSKKCPICFGHFSRTIDYIKEELIKENYILLSNEYGPEVDYYIKYKCPEGHITKMKYYHWTRGHRCRKCSNNVSKVELAVVDYLKSIGCEVITSVRDLIPPYEVDILLPDHKLAIEYCGLYWHSEKAGKGQNYHSLKTDMCTKLGIQLITIFGDEWVLNNNKVKARLATMLKGNKSVYARKCSVAEITSKQAKNFCEVNHLQGYGSGSSIKLGLFHKNELVSVMTFSKPSLAKGIKKSKEGVWELHRFCSKLNTQIIGGASKLLKYFERNFEWTEIFSYADRRWSNGNLYDKLGFTFNKITKPNYWYLDKNYTERKHRFSLRKSMNDIQELTEWENRQLQGYDRIWDCGNIKYIKEFNT